MILKKHKYSSETYIELIKQLGGVFVYQGSKGWYVSQLKKMGINKHPIERKKLESYKTYVLRNMYLQKVKEEK